MVRQSANSCVNQEHMHLLGNNSLYNGGAAISLLISSNLENEEAAFTLKLSGSTLSLSQCSWLSSEMLTVYPQTKIYFAHWPDQSLGSAQVKKHGETVMGAITDAVGKMDDLIGGLSSLSDLHATKLRIDPGNFYILTHNILVTLAVNFPADFTAEVHVAVDKFLAALSAALADKYRLTHHSGASRASANRGTSNDKAKVSDAINKISNNRKGFFFMFFSRSI
uniref:Hemoglobin, alpha adult 2 n=1 Tax=Cyprinus carpio carpio TaxID=630221 RepID=A0A8C0Y7P9_CYPCA